MGSEMCIRDRPNSSLDIEIKSKIVLPTLKSNTSKDIFEVVLPVFFLLIPSIVVVVLWAAIGQKKSLISGHTYVHIICERQKFAIWLAMSAPNHVAI